MMTNLELLTSSEESLEWFQENFLEIKEKYQNKMIAIKNKQIVAIASNTKDLLKILKEKGINESEVLIESIIPKNEIVIL